MQRAPSLLHADRPVRKSHDSRPSTSMSITARLTDDVCHSAPAHSPVIFTHNTRRHKEDFHILILYSVIKEKGAVKVKGSMLWNMLPADLKATSKY